ncbi:hypothetical protein [Roseomonas chloroacetimidivorans]|uniref:hypothetical protein n=1 Tax=Roseomonas chloroacetimidivorans TaxID=1766656 RepID=UPI003C73F034
MDHDVGEAEAMAWFYAQPPEELPPSSEKEKALTRKPAEFCHTIKSAPEPRRRPLPPDQVQIEAGGAIYLEQDARRVAEILEAGGRAEWCLSGGLDLTRRNGGTLMLSPAQARRLLAAGMLPAEVAHRARR